MDKDRPMCVVHLEAQRSEDIEVIERGALVKLEDIKSKRFSDREYIKQEQEEIKNIGLTSVENIKQELQIEIEIDGFIKKENVKKEILNEVDIESDNLICGEAIKEELSEEVDIFEEDVLTYNNLLRLQELESAAEHNERKQSEGVAPAKNYKRTDAGNIQEGSTLTPGGKKPRTSVEEATSRNTGRYVFRSTKTANNSKFLLNSDRSDPVLLNTWISQKESLGQRPRIYTDGKPYECEICKVRFSRKDNLDVHLRIHSGDKPYKCEICEDRFSRTDVLKRHLRVHTGEKPYKCEVCEFRFTHKNNLKVHLNIHIRDGHLVNPRKVKRL